MVSFLLQFSIIQHSHPLHSHYSQCQNCHQNSLPHTTKCICFSCQVLLKLPASAAAAKLLQSCPTLCNPIDSSPPGSSVSGTLQARTLEWVAISSSNACMHAKSLQSCLTLCDPMDSSPPGSSVHRIL